MCGALMIGLSCGFHAGFAIGHETNIVEQCATTSNVLQGPL